LSPPNKPELKLYSAEITKGLDEYVVQDISGFANRYYDVGKFLFTVSTFAILAVFTLRTTFGKEYDLTFFSLLFFFFCLYPSYKLIVDIDYEIDPENTILKEYELKKKWMKKYLRLWGWSFAFGSITLVITFGYAMCNTKAEVNKVELELQVMNRSLEGILQAMKHNSIQPIEFILPCEIVENAKILSELSALSEIIAEHDTRTQKSFTNNEVHNDRHLEIIGNKMDRICLPAKR
jgi:hypothetical protein